MPTSENAKLEYEAGQDLTAFVALTDQGDHLEYRSAASLWSNRSGYAPNVKPNGVATGLVVSVAASGSDNVVDVSAGTVYLAGVLTSVGADADLSIPRPAGANFQILSVTVASNGAIAVVEGAEHSAHSTTRGADGGPPWIPTGSVELAQVHYTSSSSGVVAATEIKAIVNTHREIYTFPTWDVVYGEVENGVLGYAGVDMTSAPMVSHSDNAGTATWTKKIYAQYYEPEFAELPDAYDFKPPGNTHSVSSKQVYGRTKGSKSSSINAGSFSAELTDGISDGLLTFADATLWFRFYQDRLKAPYILCQGSLGIDATFPADANVAASCSIAAENVALRVSG